MTCWCNEWCSDCEEKYTGNVNIAWECWGCSDCWKKKECCNPNIVWWNCISVDTSEEWVITISTECNPEITSNDGSVTIVKTHDDIDHWDLSVNDKNNYVWACWNDNHPSTLDQKLEWVNWITITPICNDNWKIQIGFDHSTINCTDEKVAVASWCTPWYLWDLITVQSWSLEKVVNGCKVVIRDKTPEVYYAKMVLAQNKTWNLWARNTAWYNSMEWWWTWKPINPSYSSEIQSAFNHNCWIDTRWGIIIRKKWLYHVGFSWSMEVNYWVHAFRMQLYRFIDWSNNKTILESRYSAPLWFELWSERFNNTWLIKVPSSISEEWEIEEYKDYKLDFPLIWDKTEAEWMVYSDAYSQSMGSILDRVPVNWDTIVELNVWDVILPWVKLSTEVKHAWLMEAWVWLMPWQMTLLWSWQEDWDNGSECWFSFFVDLIHPLVI